MISLFVLVFILLLSITSIGWGPIPGWWKYSYSDVASPRPTQPPTLSAVHRAGVQLLSWGDFPFGADRRATTTSRR